MISIVLTIHNQEKIIWEVLGGIFRNNTSLVKELILVFDGCTDDSRTVASDWIEDHKPGVRVVSLITNDLFETKANNAGLKEVSQPYAIVTQDDCIIQEAGFDLRLIAPMLYWGDLFAITGRNAHNIYTLPDGLVDYESITNLDGKDSRGEVKVRQVVNRGPLAMRMDVLRAADFFDEEFYPQNGDDHDLCLRVARFGWKCGSYPIKTYSDPSWGGTRKGDGSWIRKAIEKNMRIINQRHGEFLQTYNPFEVRVFSPIA